MAGFKLLLLLHLPLVLLIANHMHITSCLGATAGTCSLNSSLTPCQAMVTYFPTRNIKLSDMALYFFLQNYTSLLGPNKFNLSIPHLPDVVLPAAVHPFNIPIQSCACNPLLPDSPTRVATSINYTVVSGDTLSTIANEYYSGLIIYQDIASVSGIQNVNLIIPGQSLSIPIPCACIEDTNSNNETTSMGRPSEILSYQVQEGDNLSSIALSHNASLQALQSLNPNVSDSNLGEGDIVFVPLAVCKANFSSAAEDKDLQVLEGAYALTANGCVQCNCENGTLYCFPSNFSSSSACSNNQTCFNSTLKLGDLNTSQIDNGCLVTSCIYMGYNSSTILSRLETEVEEQCPLSPSKEIKDVYNPPSNLEVSSSAPPPPSTPTTPESPPTSPSLAPPTSPSLAGPPLVGSLFTLFDFVVLALALWAPFLL